MCIEKDNQATQGVTQEDVAGSYQLMQQQLKQANETIATLLEQLKLTQQTTSQLIAVFLNLALKYLCALTNKLALLSSDEAAVCTLKGCQSLQLWRISVTCCSMASGFNISSHY